MSIHYSYCLCVRDIWGTSRWCDKLPLSLGAGPEYRGHGQGCHLQSPEPTTIYGRIGKGWRDAGYFEVLSILMFSWGTLLRHSISWRADYFIWKCEEECLSLRAFLCFDFFTSIPYLSFMLEKFCTHLMSDASWYCILLKRASYFTCQGPLWQWCVGPIQPASFSKSKILKVRKPCRKCCCEFARDPGQ